VWIQSLECLRELRGYYTALHYMWSDEFWLKQAEAACKAPGHLAVGVCETE